MNQEQNIKQDDTIRIGKKLKVEFTSITHDGMGICKINGINSKGEEYNNFPIFVLGALPKEEGIIEIEKLHSSYGYGKLLKVFTDKTSKYRTKPICPNYPDCGGCNIMHMNYEGQLEFKRGLVKDTFKKIAGMEKVIVKDVIGMNNPYYYRNKVQVPFAQNMGKNTCGFYRRNTHEIIPLQQCYIQPEESTEVVKFVKNLCNEMKYKGYDEKTDCVVIGTGHGTFFGSLRRTGCKHRTYSESGDPRSAHQRPRNNRSHPGRRTRYLLLPVHGRKL